MVTDDKAIREQLECICSSRLFSGADTLRDLFQYIVHKSLAGDHDALRKKALGMRIWGKPRNWKPKEQPPIVQVSIRQLRKKLGVYYNSLGAVDPVVITIPKGSYVAEFSARNSALIPFPSLECSKLVANAITALDSRTLNGSRHAMYYLGLALKLSPGNPRIISLQALCHLNRAYDGQPSREEIGEAEGLLNSIEPVEQCWEYSYAQACLKTVFWKWREAGELYENAIALNNDVAIADGWYCVYLISQLELEKVTRLLADAIQSDHGYRPAVRADYAAALMAAGQFDRAEEAIEESLNVLPHAHYLLNIILACVREGRGDTKGAAEAINRISPSEETSLFVGLIPLFEGLNGNLMTASTRLASMIAAREFVPIPATQIALAAIGAGQIAQAVSWYKIAEAEHEPSMIFINTLPFLRRLRGSVEFNELVTKTMGLRFRD